MDTLVPSDLKAKLAKRGLAYECVKCGEKFRGEKRRVRAHVYKYHMALDEVPFYCSLCHYMTDCERDITRHIKGYKPHQNMIDSLQAQGKEVAENYIHKNLTPKPIGDEQMRPLTGEESQLVWLSRLRPAGPEGSTAGGPAGQEGPVDQEDPVVNQEEQQIVPPEDPLTRMPEALVETDSVVPVISLPDIDLPLITDSQEEDILADILQDESHQAASEFPEEAQVAAGAGILSEILACMQDIRTEAQQTNRLLTTLNMAVRKNTMAMDELASSVRARERQERDRQQRTSPYHRDSRPRSVIGLVRRAATTARKTSTSRARNDRRK